MIPGAKDCDYWRGEDPFTVEQVRAFKEAYDDYGFVDDYHAIRDESSADPSKIRGHALKSVLLSEPTSYSWFDGTVHTYPTGTWMLTCEVTDQETIQKIQDGTITGYSPSVFKRETAEKIRTALKQTSLKASAGGLIKNINDPVPALVSLVRKPCQHGNKFCKTSNVGENMSEDNAQSTLNKIRSVLNGDKPEYATKEDLDEIKEMVESAFKSDDFKTSLQAMINEAVVSALQKPGLKEDSEEKPEKPDEEEDAQNEPAPNEEADESEEKPEEEKEEKPAQKEDSKALPQHDVENRSSFKSDTAIVMETMGRNMRGRPLDK